MASDPTYPLYPIIAFTGFILTLIPLSWHLQSWNAGTCFYMIWASLACLNQFVNSVVWANDAINRAPVWCDISTRIILGASVGVPCASLCIMRRLCQIARVQAVTVSRAEKRRDVLVDTLICVLFPCIYMALAYICQGHRFNIFEEIGCYPAIYNTLPAYFLVYMWPVVIGSVSAVYCALSLWALYHRRAQFMKFLSSGSGLTSGRYFRLMALALTEILFTVPFGVYEIYSNTVGDAVEPWISWEDTHYDFSRVVLYPAVIWKMDPSTEIPLELARWIVPFCSFVFFGYFGFAEEARRHYREAYLLVRRRLGLPEILTKPQRFGTSGPSSTPAYTAPPAYSPRSIPYLKSLTVDGESMHEKDGSPLRTPTAGSVAFASPSTSTFPPVDDPDPTDAPSHQV